MNRIALLVLALAAVCAGVCTAQDSPAEQELRAAETAFAATMAARDHATFAGFLSDEVVFFNGDTKLTGREAVAGAWARFFAGEAAPFSWAPEAVAVLASGDLGMTSGPVRGPDGARIGTFNSVWRKDGDGRWRIVFDRGCPACE